MRSTLLLTITILLFFTSPGQIVNIPDANFKNALLNHVPVINTNGDGEIQVSEALAFTGTINVQQKNIADLTGINAFSKIQGLICSNNQITSLNVSFSGFPLLRLLYCKFNQLNLLSITDFPLLDTLLCDSNPLTALTINNLPKLKVISIGTSDLTGVVLNNLPSLTTIYAAFSRLNAISLIGLPSLKLASFSFNKIRSYTFKQLPLLRHLDIDGNPFNVMALDSLPSLIELVCGRSDSLISLSLKLPSLISLRCDSSKITEADLSQTGIVQLNLTRSPSLKYINLKNGVIVYNNYNFNYNFASCTALTSVCVDDSEYYYITYSLNQSLRGQNVSVSSFCNFNPTGNYNTIVGTVRYDEPSNGCTTQDSVMNYVKINLTDGAQSGSTYTNFTGQYHVFAQLSPNTVSADLPNNWFSILPPSHIISFSGYGNTAVADFCVQPIGVHHDLDIALFPYLKSVPGFDAWYRLVYTNKGTKTESGNLTLNFNSNKLNFVSAIPAPSSQSGNTLTWTYTNLPPFNSRGIAVTYHVKPPPVTNIGDTLVFFSRIDPVAGDETPGDNLDTAIQIASSSYDPNNKVVKEGSQISLAQSKKYLHYTIHFQNIGTASAISVIVKDSLASNLDWSTFMPVAASHAYNTFVSKGNLVQFIFDGINLPPKSVNEPASNGFVSFKIKAKSNVVIGDTLKNTAKIYFDFNQAIVTNTTTTVISKSPVVTDNTITPIALATYPNPVNNYLSFTVKAGGEIKSIRLFNAFGQQVNYTIKESLGLYRKLDISNLPNGFYVLEVIMAQGKDSQKIVKVK